MIICLFLSSNSYYNKQTKKMKWNTYCCISLQMLYPLAPSLVNAIMGSLSFIFKIIMLKTEDDRFTVCGYWRLRTVSIEFLLGRGGSRRNCWRNHIRPIFQIFTQTQWWKYDAMLDVFCALTLNFYLLVNILSHLKLKPVFKMWNVDMQGRGFIRVITNLTQSDTKHDIS